MQKINSFKTLQLLHTALLLEQIAFVAIAFFLIKINAISPVFAQHNKIIQPIILLYTATVCYVGIQVYFKNKVYAIRDTDANTAEKFYVYKKACIVQWACIKSASIVSIIGFLLAGN